MDCEEYVLMKLRMAEFENGLLKKRLEKSALELKKAMVAMTEVSIEDQGQDKGEKRYIIKEKAVPEYVYLEITSAAKKLWQNAKEENENEHAE